MAFEDGNSVTFTPTVDLQRAAAGLNANYPISFAVALKPSTSGSGSVTLISTTPDLTNTGLHLLYSKNDDSVFIRQRVAPPTGNDDHTIATVTPGAWNILAVSIDAADDLRWSLNGATTVADDPVTDSSWTAGAFNGGDLDNIRIGTMSGAYDAVMAWSAWWASELTDTQLENISNGDVAPTDESPTYFAYFETTTVFDENETSGSYTNVGAGTLALEGTDPTGWPPTASSSIIPMAMNYYRQRNNY